MYVGSPDTLHVQVLMFNAVSLHSETEKKGVEMTDMHVAYFKREIGVCIISQDCSST